MPPLDDRPSQLVGVSTLSYNHTTVTIWNKNVFRLLGICRHYIALGGWEGEQMFKT